MTTENSLSPWKALTQLATGGDSRELERYVESLGPAETFRALLRLTPAQREQVLLTLSPVEAAELIEEIPQEHAADLIEHLPVVNAASILNEMGSAEQVDLLAELDDDDAEAILAEMEPEAAEEARQLLPYDDDVAGGLMRTDLLAYPQAATVGDVIDALSALAEERPYDETHIYTVSASGALTGALDLRALVLTRRGAFLATISSAPVMVSVTTSLADLDDFFERNELLAAPVVDEDLRLLGVVGREAVKGALAERADFDYLKSQGVVGGDEIRSMPVLVRSRRRLSWLSLNIVLNLIAASVIAVYEDTLKQVIALAVFLPIVSDMSGCTGNQAVAVSMRELALGIVKPYEAVRVWWQELKVGLISGVVLGLLIAAAAWLWKGNPYLGLVVGAALAANTLVAVSIGGTVPLLLKRYNIDPAVASGPILTTVTDLCGFFLVLSFATALLPSLTATY